MDSVIQDITIEPTGNTNALIKLMEDCIAKGAKSLLIMSCDNGVSANDIDSYLQSISIPVFGGIFPNLAYQENILDKGSLVISLNVTAHVTILKPDHEKQSIVFNLKDTEPDDNFFIFTDGFMDNIDQLLSDIYETLTMKTTAIGGGCGLANFKQNPCIFTNNGLLENVMVLASLATPLSIGTAHGWNVMSGPYLVTSSDKHTIHTLDYMPALHVYKNAIKQSTGMQANGDDFYDIARMYPLGLDQLNNELLVRDPISSDGNNLVCLGNVPNNSMIYILEGENSQLMHAAGQAVSELKASLTNDTNATFFSFDCISRAIFLGDDLQNEINLICNALPVQSRCISALSLGEIALTRSSAMQLHNKSIVIGSMC